MELITVPPSFDNVIRSKSIELKQIRDLPVRHIYPQYRTSRTFVEPLLRRDLATAPPRLRAIDVVVFHCDNAFGFLAARMMTSLSMGFIRRYR